MLNSKNKGNRIERDFVKYCQDNDINAHRIPLSGSMANYKNDVILQHRELQLSIEVKGRKNPFTDYKWLNKCKKDAIENHIPGLVKKSNNKDFLITLFLSDFLKILKIYHKEG